MSDSEPIIFRPRSHARWTAEQAPTRGSEHPPHHSAHLHATLSQSHPQTPQVAFNRTELTAILALYGRKVASGEWRDYAIDLTRDKAVFSVFRRTSEVPLYRIEKDPKLARKQGAYSVIAAGGLILKRGHDLIRVLGVLDRPLDVVRS